MSEIRGSMMMMQTPNGEGQEPPVKFTYQEMQHLMTTMPVHRINFPDEDGKIKKDTITFQEVAASTHTTLDVLFEAWSQLRGIMAQHQTTVNKRWLKKTIDQRKAILSTAWPEMPTMHRPDFEVWRQEQQNKKVTFAKDFALRFPHINCQDLSQPNTLLLMFDSRSRSPPSAFTNADRESIRVGIKSKMLVPKYLRGYAMYLNGEQTRKTYGRLVPWQQDRQAVLRCHNGVSPDPGMGLMILEIQRDVMQFLVRCSAAILHDIPMVELIKPATGSLPDCSKSLSSLTNGQGCSIAPYQIPDAYDFARLRSLVEAKCREVNDHFLLIREDPAYFATLIREECGHTVEAILDRRYTPDSSLSEASWNNAIARGIMHAYHDAFMWKSVSNLVDQLAVTYAKCSNSIRPGQILPYPYVKVVSRLGFFLDCVIVGYLGALPEYMTAVPTFRKLITNRPHEDGKYTSYMQRQPELVTSKDDKNKRICGLADVLQEMESLIVKDQQQRKRLSWRLVRMIADVSVITEIQRQLDLAMFSDYLLSAWSDEENTEWMNHRVASLLEIREVFHQDIGVAPLVMDLRAFDYPSDRKRTAATTAKMRGAEQALDNFWEALSQHFQRKTGKTLKELEGSNLQCRDIQRTPAWTELRHPGSEEHGDGAVPKAFDVSHALATLEERTERTIDQSQPIEARQKAKTRGSSACPGQTESQEGKPEGIHSTSVTEFPTLTVKKKAFNTFAALFGKPIADKLPGELPWSEFKKAMVNVGFSAEKLRGSGWLFDSGVKSIIFHEPHPESKLPMQWARRIARRLNRNFGWTVDTFVPESVPEDTSGKEKSKPSSYCQIRTSCAPLDR
ncbi:MAG: hypothetical protein Q9210_004186 [Variospora velana]